MRIIGNTDTRRRRMRLVARLSALGYVPHPTNPELWAGVGGDTVEVSRNAATGEYEQRQITPVHVYG